MDFFLKLSARTGLACSVRARRVPIKGSVTPIVLIRRVILLPFIISDAKYRVVYAFELE